MTDLLDTGPLGAARDDEAQDGSARRATTPADAWRRAKVPVLVGALVIGIAVLQAIARGGVSGRPLDPDAAAPPGARALATLLRERGVEVEAPTPGTTATVFFPLPQVSELLRPGSVAAAADAREVVVVSPEQSHLAALDVAAAVSGGAEVAVREPGCAHPDAAAAGAVRLGGATFGAEEDATPCYAADGEASFVELTPGDRRVTLLGSGAFMTNDRLDEDGNAALALRVLGRQRVVEWVYPRTLPVSADQERSLTSFLPHRFFVLVAQLLVVVLLLALWRARRLGPVVVEPLPVVVRAAEAVEGRARLYEAAGARDRAADSLRAGLRDRLVRALGLAPDAPRETLVTAVTIRTPRGTYEVDALLYGPPPADDDALVALATELDRLDAEVRDL